MSGRNAPERLEIFNAHPGPWSHVKRFISECWFYGIRAGVDAVRSDLLIVLKASDRSKTQLQEMASDLNCESISALLTLAIIELMNMSDLEKEGYSIYYERKEENIPVELTTLFLAVLNQSDDPELVHRCSMLARGERKSLSLRGISEYFQIDDPIDFSIAALKMRFEASQRLRDDWKMMARKEEEDVLELDIRRPS